MIPPTINLSVGTLPVDSPENVKTFYDLLSKEIEKRQPDALHHVVAPCNFQDGSTGFGVTFDGAENCAYFVELQHDLNFGMIDVTQRSARDYVEETKLYENTETGLALAIQESANWITR